jgi:hypothetical protein
MILTNEARFMFGRLIAPPLKLFLLEANGGSLFAEEARLVWSDVDLGTSLIVERSR